MLVDARRCRAALAGVAVTGPGPFAAAAFMAFTMGVAFFGFHAGDPFRVREMAMLYGVVALGFLVGGSGRFGLDALLARRWGGADVLSGGGR